MVDLSGKDAECSISLRLLGLIDDASELESPAQLEYHCLQQLSDTIGSSERLSFVSGTNKDKQLRILHFKNLWWKPQEAMTCSEIGCGYQIHSKMTSLKHTKGFNTQ